MTSNHSAAAPAAEALAGRLARLGPGAGVDGRQAVLPDPLRGFHPHLLKAFLTGTGAPDAPVIAGQATELGLDPQAARRAFGGLLDPSNPRRRDRHDRDPARHPPGRPTARHRTARHHPPGCRRRPAAGQRDLGPPRPRVPPPRPGCSASRPWWWPASGCGPASPPPPRPALALSP